MPCAGPLVVIESGGEEGGNGDCDCRALTLMLSTCSQGKPAGNDEKMGDEPTGV